MTCQDLLAMLHLLLDEAAGPARGSDASRELDEGRRHLGTCTSCRALIDLYQRTGEWMREAFDDSSQPEELPEEMVKTILRRRVPTR